MVRRLIAGKVSVAVEYDLRERLYGHLQSLELGFFDSQQTGQLMSRATVDLQSIRFFLGYGLIFLTQNALTLAARQRGDVHDQARPRGAGARAGAVRGPLGDALQPALAAGGAGDPAAARRADRRGRGVRSPGSGSSRRSPARSTCSGASAARCSRVFDQNIYSTRLQAFYSPLLGFLPSLGLAVVLLVGGRAGDQRRTLARRLHRLLHLPDHAHRPDADARHVARAWRSGPSRRATGCSRSSIASRGSRARRTRLRCRTGPGAVELRDVSLAYDGGAPALEDVELEVEARAERSRWSGRSGSGKTSLVALLARLYDPSRGLGARSTAPTCATWTSRSLRSQIAFVADDSFLFSATVAENIAYARPEATREEIELAARRAQAHGFIERLPDGYETLVGERGLTLSGGQRQRIAIARALLADPRILILDDATSSVDARPRRRSSAACAR